MFPVKTIHRRTLLKAGLALSLVPSLGWAQSQGPIKVGSITPLTGGGASYGGRMRDAIAAVVDSVNGAGGIAGRQVVLVSEDDQTNPEAGVRSARKLIDVDEVVAIMGVWASSVTTAIAPLCWESKTMVLCTSGSNSITLLPHQGYVVRTEPGSDLWADKIAGFAAAEGAKKPAYLGVQTPFAEPMSKRIAELNKNNGLDSVTVIYEADKNSYRSEVNQIMDAGADFIYLAGYSPDTIVVLRDLYRAGFNGKLLSQNYTLDTTLLEALPAEVTEGVFAIGAVTPEDSPGFASAKALLKTDQIDPYVAQAFDHANLVMLALGASASQNGEGIRDNLRAISQGDGQVVGSAVEGLKLLAEGKKVNFDGASGELAFNDIGDITSFTARIDVIKNKQYQPYKTM